MQVKLGFTTAAIADAIARLGKCPESPALMDVDAPALSEQARKALSLGEFTLGGRSGNERAWTLTVVNEFGTAHNWHSPFFPSSQHDWERVLLDYAADRAAALAKAEANRREKERKEAERIATEARRKQEITFLTEQAGREYLANAELLPYTVYDSHVELETRATAAGYTFRPTFQNDTEVYTEARRRRDAAKAATEAKQKAEREAREQAKRDWIAAHGSDFLKKAFDAGYDCTRKYVEERAALEFPGYTLDYSDDASFSSRSCPSEAALDEALKVGGDVVWLKDPGETIRKELGFAVEANGYEDDDLFTPCEAVHVRFLDKYDLLKLF